MLNDVRLRIAVVGGGVAGIAAAHLLQRRHEVTLFEKNGYVGGHRRLGNFFSCCGLLLKPGCLMALQTITIPDERYDDYRRGVDWIRKHIFPGGHLSSLGAIRAAVAVAPALTISETEEIGPHYARTLREWRNRFLAQTPALEAMGLGSAFRRKWVYYLASCEAGFATGATGNLQIVLGREPGR